MTSRLAHQNSPAHSKPGWPNIKKPAKSAALSFQAAREAALAVDKRANPYLTSRLADYLEVLDLVQEAALEPAAWERILRQLAKLTLCTAGGLTIENPKTGEGTPLVYFGFDENHVEKTFAYYLPMNPLFKIAALMKPGFIVTNGDVIPTEKFRRTEFYDGWARLQNLCSPLTLVLHRADSVYCPLTLVRSDGTGEATDDDRALLTRLAPHLIRAMRVSMQLNLLRHQRFAMEQSLTRIAIAVLLLNRRKRVVFANPAAEKLLASGTALTTVNGALEEHWRPARRVPTRS